MRDISPTGTVLALWRYPVKSMMGEQLNACFADERGLLGDRGYAVIDAQTGKVASAKNPRLWGRLFDCRAAYVEPPQPGGPRPLVRITLPDGTTVDSGDANLDTTLSDVFSRKVTLAEQAAAGASYESYWPDIEDVSPDGYRDTVTDVQVSPVAPSGAFFDVSGFHILTTQSLDALRVARPQSRFEPRRFRPNLVVRGETHACGFIENDWVGHVLWIGADLALRVLIPTMRCVMTTLAQDDLPHDADVLRGAVAVNLIEGPYRKKYPCVGVYASLARKVSRGGRIRRGDPCWLE